MPTSSLSSLVQPALSAGSSTQAPATDIANAYQSSQMQQAKLQQMQQQQQVTQQALDDAKYKTVTGTTQTAMQMSDPIFKVSEDALEKRLKQVNPDYQEGTLAALRQDPDLKASTQSWLKAVMSGELPSDPTAQKTTIAAMGDPGHLETYLNQQKEVRQLQSAQMLKEAALATSRQNAQTAATGRVEAAGVAAGPGTPRTVRTQEAVAKDYDASAKPFEATLNAVDQLKSTLADVDSGRLSAAKNVKSEIESKLASVFGGGKPSTVFGTQAVGLDSAYGDFRNHVNHILGEANGVLTDAQKTQLHQELDTFGANAAKQHEDNYLKFSASRENLPPQYTEGIHKGYSAFRQQKGLPDINNAGNVQAPMANSTAAKAASAPAPIDAKITNAVKALTAIGAKDPARIAKTLATQGIVATPQQVQAAMQGGQ